MSERLPQETLRDIELAGRTLAEWHRWLVTDQQTGENNGYLGTPGSRYGSRSEDAAWWAVGAAVSYEALGGVIEDEEALVDGMMADAVNDRESILEVVREAWFQLPHALRERLDYYEGDCNMAQASALGRLCSRYTVTFVAEHYTPQFDLPSGYVAGFIGGWAIQKEHPTIYVGCDEEGAISS